MARLEDLRPGSAIRGIVPDALVTVLNVNWYGDNVVELTYKDAQGKPGIELLYRDREASLEVAVTGRPWSFDADGGLLRLVSEAYRIRLAYLFDPVLAVHTSLVDPLPHQITAVYHEMLTRQPLRFLLADDPGAGKTIMAGLLIKELLIRGDLRRCLIVCPGNLVEQWQDELYRRFHLPFEILTNDKLESARTGNWLAETSLAICRLDKLSRDEDLQEKLGVTDWDLVVCDEAHKLSASYFGGEVKYTKRYLLGQKLSGLTRNFLLMTATPHNGKEADFQLFMALIDSDRFEGKYREGVHETDASDLMRRLVKEKLLKFDGTPLFPERMAYTVNYALSPAEAVLYKQVTDYVKDEFNRADDLDKSRRGTVGFALTILQRRLASSPEAIYQSLCRRRERLEKRLREEQLLKRGADARIDLTQDLPLLDDDDLDDLDDAPETEVEAAEERVVDQASAARTIQELQAEIATLKRLEDLAQQLRVSRADKKWDELSRVIQDEVNSPSPLRGETASASQEGSHRKLVIFTEHRDTLTYLCLRIRALLGRAEAVATIHGGMSREERRHAQEAFTQDREVQILVATDAAGEGINLQRAYLMVNYDLPWNPNRLEQRFGRIHRIGQTEVCHLWNIVAKETQEGHVYTTLLKKLEQERDTLGGQVFDVLGKVTFDNRPLRELLVEAIRYGDRPDVQARLTQIVDTALDHEQLITLLDERALADETMDVGRVQQIREEMERADARRLQPHYIASFFLEAFRQLGGTVHERESHRYEITHVPAIIRNRDRQIGTGQPVLQRYERITFEKPLISLHGKPVASFVCPGHPLLDATIDILRERHRDLLKRGAVLVNPSDGGDGLRVLFYLEHAIQDARIGLDGNRRVISRRLQFVEIDGQGNARAAGYAPYLDYRPLHDDERELLAGTLEAPWLRADLEKQAMSYAIQQLVPQHFEEVKKRKEALLDRTIAAVKERLTKEVNYWDLRAQELKLLEEAGRTPKLNSARAQQRAGDLEARMQKRLTELEQERHLSAAPPVVVGGAAIVPAGLLALLRGEAADSTYAYDTTRSEQLAMAAVMAAEESLGYQPRSVAADKCGYDVESRVPSTGRLRFIEVKGRAAGATTVTLTRNEILTALNKPDDFILAVVEIDGDTARAPRYIRQPFHREPDFSATSVNYSLAELLQLGALPG